MTIRSSPIETWLKSFPYDEAKTEEAAIQAQLTELGDRLSQLQEAIRLFERHRLDGAAVAPEETKPPAVVAPSAPRPSLREAITMLVMEDPNRPWHVHELGDQLVDRSLLRADAQGRNNLLAMLSVMTKQGQLERIRTGWYRLPSAAVTQAGAGAEEAHPGSG